MEVVDSCVVVYCHKTSVSGAVTCVKFLPKILPFKKNPQKNQDNNVMAFQSHPPHHALISDLLFSQ